MCPLYPLHLVFTWGFVLLFAWILGGESIVSALQKNAVDIRTLVDNVLVETLDLNEEEIKSITVFVDDLPPDAVGDVVVKEKSDDGLSHVHISPEKFPLQYDPLTGNREAMTVNISGAFLGFSKVKFMLTSGNDSQKELLELEQELKIKVHREPKQLDKAFVFVIVLLVLVAYVNMGCAISLDVVKATLRRPVAPSIGLASQYLFMPLISYGLGYAVFSSSHELWLGLFLTGCAPGGGASNMWTYVLGGSLDLSITMTFLSTVLAFATLPLWVYALGPSIFADGSYGKLPYGKIATLVFGLVVPCGIGLGIRRYFPKVADLLKMMLKPLSIFFIIFIMTFGIYAKFYLFYFYSWKVALTGFLLPLLGFAFGGLMAVLLKRDWEEVVAISVETGVQNTGLAIGVLQVALRNLSPMDDIAIVLPVAVATMTPVPLFVCLIFKWLRGRRSQELQSLQDHCDDAPMVISQVKQYKDINNLYGDPNGNSKAYIP